MSRPAFPQALFALAGLSDAEYIAGDLHEEFAMRRAELGGPSAWRWYAWQVLRCLARPLALRLPAAFVALALLLALLDRMWRFVYTQLCAEPVPGLGPANILGLLAGASLLRPGQRVLTMGLLATGLAAGLTIGPAAFPHIISMLLSVPAGAAAAKLRKAVG
jgi:hypothetical protein